MNYQAFQNSFFSEILPNKNKDERKGQALMNYLADVWVEEYKRISSIDYYNQTNIDCFYNDKLISNTFRHLENVWENYPK